MLSPSKADWQNKNLSRWRKEADCNSDEESSSAKTNYKTSGAAELWSWRWYTELICHCWCICAVPFLFITPQKAFISIILANSIYQFTLMKKHGLPDFTSRYVDQLIQDEDTYHFSYSLICLIILPWSPLVLTPLLLRIVSIANFQLKLLVSSKAPRIYSKCLSFFKFFERRNLNAFAAKTEVLIGVIMIPGIIIMHNTPVQALVFWLFMRRKYITSKNSKFAFGSADALIRDWLPKVFVFGYDKLVQRLASPQSEVYCVGFFVFCTVLSSQWKKNKFE